MKVRILSGNLAGVIQDLSRTEAEVAVATGYAERVAGPADPAETAAEARLTMRVRYLTGDRKGQEVNVAPADGVQLINRGEAEHVKQEKRVRYLRGEKAGQEYDVSDEQAEQLLKDGEVESVAVPDKPAPAEPVKVKVRYTAGPRLGQEAEVTSDEALKLVQTGEAVAATEPKPAV